MNPLLYNAPTDVGMWLSFGAVHQLDHFAINRQIFNKTQRQVPMRPLDPVPLENTQAMLTWFQNHQAVHNLMNAAIGIGGFDLSYVDFNDRVATDSWMQNHAQEHTRISALLAGLQVPSLPSVFVPQPIMAQPNPAVQPQPQPALQPQPAPAVQPQPAPAPQSDLRPGTPLLPGNPNP